MTIKWSFRIDLKEGALEKVEKKIGRPLPKELRDLIKEGNAASPDKSNIIINGNERVLNSLLSFNDKETEAATFKSVYMAIGNKQIIPFASDPFGNYFCYSIKTNKIVFYKHEEGLIEETTYSLKKFIDSLY